MRKAQSLVGTPCQSQRPRKYNEGGHKGFVEFHHVQYKDFSVEKETEKNTMRKQKTTKKLRCHGGQYLSTPLHT